MPTTTQKNLSGIFAGAAADAEMQTLENVLRPLTANGFEFRGGDTFGQEIYSIYINDKSDEFVILRFNRPSSQPPLIHRGAIGELDGPMEVMNSMKFVTIPEFMGEASPRTPVQQISVPASAAPQMKINKPGFC